MIVVQTNDTGPALSIPEPLPNTWRRVRLGEVCDINPRREAVPGRDADAQTTFIPMTAVDDQEGIIARPEVKAYAEVRKGYTFFKEGDVLFAKITPCMQNGKHAVARNLLDGIGFGSTEFHVLRPGPDITSDWIHRFLRQPSVLLAAIAHFSGSVGQQRVPDTYLAALEIPLPPLVEQQRIAAFLAEQMAAVERARRAAEAQVEAAQGLSGAYLRELFESVEAQQWPMKTVSQVCSSIDYGHTASADFSVTEPRFLRITDIQDGGVNWTKVPGCQIGSIEEANKGLADGDIVFARTGGTTGKSFLVRTPPRAVFASYLIRLRPKREVSAEYLYAFFQSDSYWRQIRASARGGAQPNVNATLLGSITLPIAPRADQARVLATLDAAMTQVRRSQLALEAQRESINQLPAALLRQAFSGAL